MKTIWSLPIMVAAVTLLAFNWPGTASSEMMDMPMHEQHREGQDRMTAMGNMDPMGDMLGMCLEHAEEMGLTGDQLKKMKPLHRELQKKQARSKADLRIAEIDLLEILEVKDFDLEKASSAINKIAGIKTAHKLEILKAMKEMRTILTDTQFEEMKKAMMPMKRGDRKPALGK